MKRISFLKRGKRYDIGTRWWDIFLSEYFKSQEKQQNPTKQNTYPSCLSCGETPLTFCLVYLDFLHN
jgi:hypothetical protein